MILNFNCNSQFVTFTSRAIYNFKAFITFVTTYVKRIITNNMSTLNINLMECILNKLMCQNKKEKEGRMWNGRNIQ